MLPVSPATENRDSSLRYVLLGLQRFPFSSIESMYVGEPKQAPNTLHACEMHALSFRREFYCPPILRLC